MHVQIKHSLAYLQDLANPTIASIFSVLGEYPIYAPPLISVFVCLLFLPAKIGIKSFNYARESSVCTYMHLAI